MLAEGAGGGGTSTTKSETEKDPALKYAVGAQIGATPDRLHGDRKQLDVRVRFALYASPPLRHLELEDDAFYINSLKDRDERTYTFSRTCVETKEIDENVSYSAVLMLDQTASMGEETDPNDERFEGVSQFFKNLRTNDEALLGAFAKDGKLPRDVNFYGQFDRATYDKELEDLANREGGITPLFEAALESVRKVDREAKNEAKHVIVFTDGVNNVGPDSQIFDLIREARDKKVVVHVMGIGEVSDEDIPSMSMSRRTKGSVMWIPDVKHALTGFDIWNKRLASKIKFYEACWTVLLDKPLPPNFHFGALINVDLPKGFATETARIPFYVYEWWVGLDPLDLDELPNLKSVDGVETTVYFVNDTDSEIVIYWVNFEGEEIEIDRTPAGYRANVKSRAGHVLLVKDSNGQNLSVYRADEISRWVRIE